LFTDRGDEVGAVLEVVEEAGFLGLIGGAEAAVDEGFEGGFFDLAAFRDEGEELLVEGVVELPT
jgi:hypothetical protein